MSHLIRYFSVLVVAIAFLSSCSKQRGREKSPLDEWMESGQQLRVLSTTAMIYDVAKEVGGKYAIHEVLISGEVDPHSYELVKGDDEKLGRANLIFYNGLGLEHGASIHYALKSISHKAVGLGDVIAENTPEKLLYIDKVLDPHIWMDVSLWRQIIDPIVQKYCEVDPAHEHYYIANGAQAKEKYARLDRHIFDQMQSIPSQKRYLVTSHDAFNYFARRYLATPDELKGADWCARFKAPEGLAPDGQLGMHDIEQIITHLSRYNIEFVFPESNVSLDSLKKIHMVAKKKGISIHFAKTPLFGDSMWGNTVSVASYEEMVRHNAHVIASFLSESKGE